MVFLIEIRMLVEYIWCWERLGYGGKKRDQERKRSCIVPFGFKKTLQGVSSHIIGGPDQSEYLAYPSPLPREAAPPRCLAQRAPGRLLLHLWASLPCHLGLQFLDRGSQPLKGQGPVWEPGVEMTSKAWKWWATPFVQQSKCRKVMRLRRDKGPESQSHEGFKCLSQQKLHNGAGQRASP